MPKATSIACKLAGLRWPWNLAIMAMAGFPGISRGMKKLNVMAAHSATSKNPIRLTKYLIPPTTPMYYLIGFRLSKT